MGMLLRHHHTVPAGVAHAQKGKTCTQHQQLVVQVWMLPYAAAAALPHCITYKSTSVA